MLKATTAFAALALSLTAVPASAETFTITGTKGTKITAQAVADFSEPWAMTFLPDGTMLVTEKTGELFHVTPDGKKFEVMGVPKVAYGGQGGFGDIVLHPDFATNQMIYISYAGGRGASSGAEVDMAKLELNTKGGGKLSDIKRVWQQTPKVTGRGHYSHRIAFGPKGSPHEGKMFISSGDRQKLTPAQDMRSALGKLIRLNLDGSVPDDNPWADGSQGELAKTFWSIGHRNMLGLTFAPDGTLWSHEMGPRHGDELNLIERGSNYGWPEVSNGDHYSGRSIPDHDTRPEFNAPEAWWSRSIAPSGLIIYSGDTLPGWKGDALIGGLRGQALVHVDINGTSASEAERFEWGERIREVEQGPQGNVWVLEDNGRLVKLMPAG
ncbi:PQQ-dependent sugar dehydrogenase [Pseudahrensia aquimaris]